MVDGGFEEEVSKKAFYRCCCAGACGCRACRGQGKLGMEDGYGLHSARAFGWEQGSAPLWHSSWQPTPTREAAFAALDSLQHAIKWQSACFSSADPGRPPLPLLPPDA